MNLALQLNEWWMAQLSPVREAPIRIPVTGLGVATSAERLGVTREHLSRVLHGHRVSRRLTKRFHELTGANAEVAP